MAISLERKFVLAALLVAVVGLWTCQATSRTLHRESKMSERHEQWMVGFGRLYKDNAEKEKRFKIFKDNVEYIESFNAAGNVPYKLAVNTFADQTNDEFRAAHGGCKLPASSPKKYSTSFKYANVTSVPSSVDWRDNGAVTPIKDQGSCGSCWAFSTIAATEGINQIKTGKLISLSEQELVDCNKAGKSSGCNGGLMEDGFSFIIQNKGINTEAAYPYTAEDGTCDTSSEAMSAAKISGYEKVPANSEDALLKAVANQPVSVSIDASSNSFQFYASGVYTGEDCGVEPNHGVTAVGYGETEEGEKYWIVKNSWGTDWGVDGYILMKRDVEAKEGLCGIAVDSSYPTA